ncbi:MAG: ATP-dependent 6-phosphofructokinase [Candidatus Krumholzibacteriota bacterium]|nr:ATP-dependent 6-phosphofructokinase [Candidatus Krumholzibacteriota bacterium]
MEPNLLEQPDFLVEDLGPNRHPSPLKISGEFYSAADRRVLFNNTVGPGEDIRDRELLSFGAAGPHKQIHFDSSKINVGIVTCGGLCPGINDVVRSVTYSCLDGYGVKTVYGFRFGYAGLTYRFNQEAIRLTSSNIDNIHEQGGSILGSSRGDQSIEDIVDTLVKFNISILFVIGGDGTQRGSMEIAREIKRRKIDIAVVGIPKTIDNDISFIHKTFGFDTAVGEARKAIDAAHIEAKGARNGIGLVKLMGRHSGFIAAHATLASGNVNICLIPEVPLDIDQLYRKIMKRLSKKNHLVIVVAEGAGQNYLCADAEEQYDPSGNVRLKDIGLFLKQKIGDYLNREKIEHTLKYIDPSYMIRSTPANAIDSSFCLRMGNYAVHAGMAGKTNSLIGYWNQNFCLVPIKLALSRRKTVDVHSSLWQSIMEITE